MKKFALTSMVAILAVSPSFAAPTNTSATFPQNGYMLEDYTYTNAATATNMAGVYEDSVNADADYGDCPAGYWCDASGQHACSTAGDGSYTSSGTGANENTACYKSCTVATANIAHATAVTGNDYYGAGTDTCSATSCENGYHTQIPDWNTLIGTNEGTEYVYIRDDGVSGSRNGIATTSTYGINDPMEFAVDYGVGKGYFTGHARCSTNYGICSSSGGGCNGSTTDPDEITTISDLADETGQGGKCCYCQIDSYTAYGGSSRKISGPWVAQTCGLGPASGCAEMCSQSCAQAMYRIDSGYLVFRAAILGELDALPTACAANVITINWSGASAADIAANEAGTVTYGGDIRTPRAAEIIPGKVFTGWTFSAPFELAPSEPPAQ